MPALKANLLGPFRVWRDGARLTEDVWPTLKSKALLKILLTERGHFVPAERLMDWLWPDLEPKKAQNNLWVAVSHLRRALEPGLPARAPSGFVLTSPEGYAFNPDCDCWLDVVAFSSSLETARAARDPAARQAALETARGLYGGAYLEEDPYEDWATPARERLQADFLWLLAELAEIHARAGRFSPAIALCQESLALDPIQEGTYRALMLYHYCAGEQAAALRAYNECRRALAEEVGVEPMAETTTLYHQIQRQLVEAAAAYPRRAPVSEAEPSEPPASRPALAPFVGREQELARLLSAVDRALAGRGQAALVEGEPGIGKSRLVLEAMSAAQARGMPALLGKCYQLEQALPYQPVIELLNQALALARAGPAHAQALTGLPAATLLDLLPLAPSLAEFLPPPAVPGAAAPGGPDEARQARLFDALGRVFGALAVPAGLFVAVDDLHWADHASLQFLHHLAHHLDGQRVLWVGTYRAEALAGDADLATFVHSLSRDGAGLRLSLPPLTAQHAQALLQALATIAPEAQMLGQWLHQETEGNPFFLVTILHSLREQGLLVEVPAGGWRYDPQQLRAAGAELTLPEALRASVRERLRHVPPGGRAVLEQAAVLGRRFDFATLRAVHRGGSGPAGGDAEADAGADRLLETLEDLVGRQLLREESGGGGFDFSHDKIREVVYHDISATRRARLHRTAAQRLEALLGTVGETHAAALAEHFERGQVWDKAFFYLAQAGERASGLFALSEALRLYDRAVDLAGSHPAAASEVARLTVHERRGQARALAGEFEGAEADLTLALEAVRRAALPGGAAARERSLLVQLGMVCRRADRLEQAEAYLNQALAVARGCGDQRGVADALFHLGTVIWSTGDNRGAAARHEEAVALARALDLRDLVAIQAHHGLGETFFMGGQYQPAREHFERSLALARQAGDKAYEAENLYMLAAADLGYLGAGYARARDLAAQSLAISQAAHMDWHMGPAMFIHALACGSLGDYQRGVEFARRSVAFTAHASMLFHATALDKLGYLYQDLNLLPQAEAAHAEGLAMAERLDTRWWRPRLQTNLALDRLRQGDSTVGGALQAALDLTVATGLHIHGAYALAGLAELAVARGEAASALGHARALAAMAQAGGMREMAAQASRWEGQAHALAGDHAAAEAALTRALAQAQALGRVRLVWDVHVALACLHQVQGQASLAEHHQAAGRRLRAQVLEGLDAELRLGLEDHV
jgi:DNA-binding SARP family transcriptional activator